MIPNGEGNNRKEQRQINSAKRAGWLSLRLTSSQTTSEHCCSGSSLRVPALADSLQEERELRWTDRMAQETGDEQTVQV
jgi:hypothetical protein